MQYVNFSAPDQYYLGHLLILQIPWPSNSPGMEGLELCAEGDLNVWKSWGNTTFREYIPSKEA